MFHTGEFRSAGERERELKRADLSVAREEPLRYT